MAHRHTVLLVTAMMTALASSACVPPNPGGGGCARDTSVPQPGDLSVRLNITGKVVLPNGQPDRDLGGHAVVRDRRSNVGSVLAEASVNDAGFFLLAAGSSAVPANAACRDYRIEICAPASNDGNGCAVGGPATLYAERDITDLVTEGAGQAPQQIDISNDPLIYADNDNT